MPFLIAICPHPVKQLSRKTPVHCSLRYTPYQTRIPAQIRTGRLHAFATGTCCVLSAFGTNARRMKRGFSIHCSRIDAIYNLRFWERSKINYKEQFKWILAGKCCVLSVGSHSSCPIPRAQYVCAADVHTRIKAFQMSESLLEILFICGMFNNRRT